MARERDRSTWIIGGTTLIGLGVGLVFLTTSALLFVAFLSIGVGAGLVMAALLSKDRVSTGDD